MIAINDQLGYELLDPPTQSYEIAVADLHDRFSDAV
jgi:hypothetical protein